MILSIVFVAVVIPLTYICVDLFGIYAFGIAATVTNLVVLIA